MFSIVFISAGTLSSDVLICIHVGSTYSFSVGFSAQPSLSEKLHWSNKPLSALFKGISEVVVKRGWSAALRCPQPTLQPAILWS